MSRSSTAAPPEAPLAPNVDLGVRATEADRRSRSDRAAACATIEDEKVRALCLYSVPGR